MKPAKTNRTSAAPATGCKIADSVGAILKQARLDLGCNREEAAARLKIPKTCLAGLEDGAFDKMPDDIYTKIYLKAYCKFLGLDAQTMVNLHRQERLRTLASRDRYRPTERRHPLLAVPRSQLLVAPRLIRNVVLSVLVLGLAAYFCWAVSNVVRPPRITVSSPHDGLVTTDHSITIEGQTEQETALRINGKYVTPDSAGNFKDTLDLQEGLNEIKVVGVKKHGQEAVVPLRVIVEPTQRPTAVMPGETTN